MQIGDLVTVNPAKTGLYLIIEEDPSKENNVPNITGIVLGKLYMLDCISGDCVECPMEMHEKWIEVIA